MIVRNLFISPGHNYRGHHGGTAGEHEIVEVDAIECIAGRGIVGDRYFDYQPDFKGQITFFQWEHLEAMWNELAVPADHRIPSATRRNVITEGMELTSLIGKEFAIQGVRFLGTEECRPCYWMNGAIHPQAEEWMHGRGGLRAKILQSGRLTRFLSNVSLRPAAVLLAGGKSSRMGRDKALVEIEGRPLWSRQLDLLRSLRGISGAVAVSSPLRPEWLPADAKWVPDTEGACGPMAGVLAALDWSKKTCASHLVVVAVDLPRMDTDTMDSLLAACMPGVGAVAVIGDHFEPLAAVYPVEAHEVIRAATTTTRWKLQDAVAELIGLGLLKKISVTDVDAFHNMNTPEDVLS